MKYAKKDLSKILGKILSSLNPEIVHGSRDYFSVKKSVSFEIIPVLNINKAEQAENIMDMSPLHVDWVIKNSSVKIRNEIRKLDLSVFKPYLEKADVDKSDIKNIITAQINNMPDKNEDGVPDMFEGIKGKVLRSGVNTLIDLKLKDLE